jgi:hypothetical protein
MKTTRKRTKKVYQSGKLVEIWISGAASEGWNRDKSMSFQGHVFYVGHGVERFKIAENCGQYIWLHPLSKHLNHGCYSHGLKSIELRNTDGLNVSTEWDADKRRSVPVDGSEDMLMVFTVPIRPFSRDDHQINANYLRERVEELGSFGRLQQSYKVNMRLAGLVQCHEELIKYCEYFELQIPSVDVSGITDKATARKVAMRIHNPHMKRGGY